MFRVYIYIYILDWVFSKFKELSQRTCSKLLTLHQFFLMKFVASLKKFPQNKTPKIEEGL
jgi:hypothetical protein